MLLLKGTPILFRALSFALLAWAASQSASGGPAFLVSVSNTAPRLSEMLLVNTAPFQTSIVTTTNAGVVSTSPAPWSAMAFNPAGTLYGISLASEFVAIDPATAAFSVLANLHLSSNTSGVQPLVTGAGLAFSANGSGYVSDGANFYTANLADGLCSYIGTFAQAGQNGVPLVFALADAPDGTMFGLFLSLYTVNLTNAQVTQIGSSSPFGGGNNPIYAVSAAFGSDSNLYMLGWDNAKTNQPKLYQVNTNDGTLKVLGSLPFGAHGLVALSSSNSAAPTIVFPPTDQSVMAGGSVTFSVTGRGTPTPELQWYIDGVAELNSTNSTLTITNVSPANAGAYFVVLSNANGLATSAVVSLTVTAPILASTGSAGNFTNSILGLTTNPPTETLLLKSNILFSDLSFGPRGELIALSQIPRLQGTAMVVADALFSVNTQSWTTNFLGDFLTNAAAESNSPIGMAFSPSGVLYVSSGGSLYTVDLGTAQASKVGAFPSGIAIGGIAFAPTGALFGGETNLYTINPANASVAKLAALNGVSASILADMKYGADGFLYFFDGGSDGNLYRLNPTNAQVSVAATYPSALFGLAFVPTPTVFVAEPFNQTVVAGTAATFSATATGTAPLGYQWYFDRAAIRGATNSTLAIAEAMAKDNGTYYLVVSNSLGPVTSSIVRLTTFTPPMLTKAPKAEVITPGQTIALSVSATGAPLDYQWQLNGISLPDGTDATLTIRNAQTNDAGIYTILVSSPYVGTPESASANVAVLPLAPTISSSANNSATGDGNLIISGREPANGGAASIMYQVNGAAAHIAEVSSNGLTWSAAVTLAPGTNAFSVWATNASGASASVKARYIFNPFIPVAGAYYGLFSATNAPAFDNAGYFNLTLESDHVFSGDVVLDGAKTPFTGQFNSNGVAALLASNGPGRGYEVALQLDLSGVNPLTGSVSNTTQGWTATLSAIRAAFGASLPATNYEGTYLLAMNGATNAATAPAGYSFAMAHISPTGGVTLSGTMADGAVITSTGTAISQSGEWPLYGSLLSGKGSILAWVNFPQHSAVIQASMGPASWFQAAGAGSHYYPNAFSLLNNQLSLIVNRYVPPPKGVAVLPSGNYTVQLFGGNLGASLTNNIIISPNNLVVATGLNPHRLNINIDAAAGTFSGSFVSPVTSAKTSLQGVLLSDPAVGFGYFLGTNQGGGILIQPETF